MHSAAPVKLRGRGGLGTTTLDSGVPTDDRLRNLWYRWSDGKLSGGVDTSVDLCRPPSTIPATGLLRWVLGSTGNQQQSHNGHIYEIITFVTDAPLSIEECMGISMWERDWYGDLAVGRVLRKYRSFAAGQSLLQFYGTSASASTLLPADYVDVRLY